MLVPPASGYRWYRGCLWPLSNIPTLFQPCQGGVYPSLYPSLWSQNGGAEARRRPHVADPWPFCLHLFLYSIWYPIMLDLVPIWPHLASQLGAKIHPKSLQEPSKMHPKSHLVFHHFLDGFSFCGFPTSKSTKNQQKVNQKVNPTTQQPKYRKNVKF